MTDRAATLTVVLDREIREDDLEPLLTAIRMLRGVIAVKANVSDPREYMAVEKARRELRDKLWAVLMP